MSPHARSLRAATSSWYFVQFHDDPDFSSLRSAGLTVDSSNVLSHRLYRLFLTPSQASFLSASAEMAPVGDKILSNLHPLSTADYLFVEATPGFNLSPLTGLHFKRISESTYVVHSPNLTVAASILSEVDSVYAITPAMRPVLKNRLGVGYCQLNTHSLGADGGFPRYLHSRGLTGRGIVVHMRDSIIDPTSTYFYDPAHAIENGVYNPEHRKIVYSSWPEGQIDSDAEHGTHVAGTIAGRATCDDCAASEFNGAAPDAKLAFSSLGELADVEEVGDMAEIGELLAETGAYLSSNSWGSETGREPGVDEVFDSIAYVNDDRLQLFSAGNDGTNPDFEGFHTLCSPAMAKNVLAVGALARLQVDTFPDDQIRMALIVLQLTSHDFMINATCDPLSECSRLDSLPELYTIHLAPGIGIELARTLEQIRALAEEPEPARVVITNTVFNISELAVPFALLYVEDQEQFVVLEQWGLVYGFFIAGEYHPSDDPVVGLADFSSKGPAFNGILKPEILAPGTSIVSARSNVLGAPDHGRDSPDLYLMTGTSMACPNLAGTAALLRQYFVEGHHHEMVIEPSASLMKAVLIGAADPLREGEKAPNVGEGFGRLNLGRWLPFSDSQFAMLIGDRVPIENRAHLVTTVVVTGTQRELRITMSYLDAPANADAWVPLFADLDLIVVSPSGRVFRGNHRPDGSEEHFSTTERVIVSESEIEEGKYTISVISYVHEVLPRESFAMVVVGQVDPGDGFLTFVQPTSCATDCGTGQCDIETFICHCGHASVGQSCQQSVVSIDVNAEPQNLTVDPLGVRYLLFEKPEGLAGDYMFSVRLLGLDDHWQLLLGGDGEPQAPAFTYDLNCTDPCVFEIAATPPERDSIRALLRNNSPNEEEFEIWFSVTGSEPTKQPAGLSTGAVAGIAIGATVVLVAIVAGLICAGRGSRQRAESESPSL